MCVTISLAISANDLRWAAVEGKYKSFRATVGVTQQPHSVDPSDPALTGNHVLRLPAAAGAADVWLVGTAHVSALSVEQVTARLHSNC